MKSFEQQIVPLKNGETALLRLPQKEDAAELLACYKAMAGETEFLLSSPEDIRYTVEGEERFIESALENEGLLLLMCEMDGHIVGDCEIRRMPAAKNRHRANIGISLRKAVWGQGIGTAMFKALIAQAEAWGLTQIELDFIEGNARARALYEKMGFRIVGYTPNAIRQRDGRLLHEYRMVRKMEAEK